MMEFSTRKKTNKSDIMGTYSVIMLPDSSIFTTDDFYVMVIKALSINLQISTLAAPKSQNLKQNVKLLQKSPITRAAAAKKC